MSQTLSGNYLKGNFLTSFYTWWRYVWIMTLYNVCSFQTLNSRCPRLIVSIYEWKCHTSDNVIYVYMNGRQICQQSFMLMKCNEIKSVKIGSFLTLKHWSLQNIHCRSRLHILHIVSTNPNNNILTCNLYTCNTSIQVCMQCMLLPVMKFRKGRFFFNGFVFITLWAQNNSINFQQNQGFWTLINIVKSIFYITYHYQYTDD